jgi:hypothetical protein
MQEHDPAILGVTYKGQLTARDAEWAELNSTAATGLACRWRTSSISTVELLEESIIDHGKQSAVTPVATYRVTWLPHLARPSLVITNMHFHHLPAKKAKGFSSEYKLTLDDVARHMKEHCSLLLVGDFNQAIICSPPRLRLRAPIDGPLVLESAP